MATVRNNIAADNKSFWQLVKDCTIIIPNYQREYAQGRNNRRAELIRNGFVTSLYDSIVDSLDESTQSPKTLELDFIFGGKESDEKEIDLNNPFIPVDGQQRLTILFLLHWYTFMRAKKQEHLKTLSEHFLYKARTSSETFCKSICDYSWRIVSVERKSVENEEERWGLDLELDKDGKSRISLQIKDQPWFTGAMSSDSTVKSMLVVIDCIHEHFYKLYNTIDCNRPADVLVSENCPIRFFCLDLNNALGISSGIRDLYIKMNARGVPLTDFELFKADLQKKVDQPANLDLLAGYLKDKDTAIERVKIIGKFNNEYTNFFFNLIDNGQIKNLLENNNDAQLFDISMMNFVNEVFRMNYFCTISKLGVSQKAYRADNDVFRKMSGKEFTTFINSSGETFSEKYWKGNVLENSRDEIKKCLISSLGSIIKLLDQVSEEGVSFDEGNETCRYAFSAMLKKLAADPQDTGALPFRESLIRTALYEFILKFGIPNSFEEKIAFITWSRFVWKIDRNSDFGNFDEVVETLIGYKNIISKCKNCSSDSVIDAIANCKTDGNKVLGAPAEMQLEEEIIKAKLVCNSEWKEIINQAEDYFSDCGQIWFLLDLSTTSNSNHEYELARFNKAFELSKRIFDGDRKIDKIDSNVFERALLAVKPDDNEDHLFSMGKHTINTKRFVGKDFSYHISHQYCGSNEPKEKTRYQITIQLLREMVDDPNIVDIKTWLDNYIDSYIAKFIRNGSHSNDWRKVFIKNTLLNKEIPGLSFKNGFEPAAWDENGEKYTAVYTNLMKRTNSGELNTFLLASKLSDAGVEVYYYTDSKEEYIVGGFPNRYFTADGKDVGYMNGKFYFRYNDTVTEIGNDVETIIEKNFKITRS